MNERQKIESYTRALGVFWLNFSTMEYMIRLVLYKRSGGDTKLSKKYTNVQLGQMVELNSITDYDSFEKLCDKFNSILKKDQKIDFSRIAKLRDAIAHGRVSGDGSGLLTIIKYSKPDKKKLVRVEFFEIVTGDNIYSISEEIGDLSMKISRYLTDS